jgi:hypothetical protein
MGVEVPFLASAIGRHWRCVAFDCYRGSGCCKVFCLYSLNFFVSCKGPQDPQIAIETHTIDKCMIFALQKSRLDFSARQRSRILAQSLGSTLLSSLRFNYRLIGRSEDRLGGEHSEGEERQSKIE